MAEHISSLIEGIYDAALEPSLWKPALERAAKFIDAFAISVVRMDGVKEPACFERHVGVDPHYERIYDAKYRKCDPRNAFSNLSPIGDVFNTFSVLPPRDMYETQFYQEYFKPQGITGNLRCVLERSPVTYLGAFRRGDDDRSAKTAVRRMELLVPHVRRALQISKAVDHGNAKTATFIDVLDELHAGIFLLDARCRIVHANKIGDDLLTRRVLLRTANGCLSAREPDIRRALDQGVAAAGNAGQPAVSHGITVPLHTDDGDRYVIHVLSLGSGDRQRTRAMSGAVAVLFVQRADSKAYAPSELVASRYNLTPMEVTVLFAIVDIGGVPEVARALGIAQTTVKTHLLRVFSKTNTRRQADLVKLVLEGASPFVRC